MNRRQALIGASSLLMTPHLARAAAWPEREITILVAYGAGGSTDVCTRAVAAEAEKLLGVPLQIVNRPGGQGTTAPAQVAVARPDGYTIATAGLAALAIMPHVLEVSYTLDSFSYLPAFARYLYGIAVPADSPYQSIGDLIEAGRKRRLTFAAAGAPQNVGMFELNGKYGTRFSFVPFPGGSESVTAALGKHVDFVVQNPPEMLPSLQSGRLRLLASASDTGWKEFPAVPTLRQAGYDIAIDSVIGFVAPKDVPPERLEVLSRAFLQAARMPALAETLGRFGMISAPLSAAEYEKLQRESFASFGPHLRDAGLARK